MTFAAVRGAGDDRDGVALLEAAGGGEEGEHGGEQRDGQPGRDEQRERAADAGQRLERDVGDAEQRARGGAEERAVVVGGRAEPRGGDQQHAERRACPASKAISAGTANAEWLPPVRGSVSDEQRQADGGHRHADPLAACRRVQPNSRSPSTASITTPVESTTWTMDSGASASAATCRIQAPAAIAMPIANHFERNRPRALRSGALQLDARRLRGAAVLAQEAELRDGGAQQRQPDTDVQMNRSPLRMT